MIKQRIHGFFFGAMAIALCAGLAAGCGNVAPTVERYPSQSSSPAEDLGTLFPTIQLVYPGTLQSLDVPKAYPTDINTDAAEAVIVFSHVMENSNGEMYQSLLLHEYGVANDIPVNIYPATASKYFFVKPLTGGFKNDTTYMLRVYKAAFVDNDPNRVLSFDNLVEPPAITLNPSNPLYVEYAYRTAPAGSRDVQPPTLLSSTSTFPTNGEINVDPGLLPGGYIQIVFLDNVVPMINPVTVNGTSIVITNVTDSLPVTVSADIDTTDYDFKTFKIFPITSLLNDKQYRVRISAGDLITDFSGNAMSQVDIYFNTAP